MKTIDKRIPELDSLRGLAILAIMLFHYTTRFNQVYGHSPSFTFYFPAGYLGVQLFFIISGFTIMEKYHQSKKPLQFAFNRFSRLFPSYWVAIIFIYTATSFFPLPERQISFQNFLINFSMLQHWLGVPDVDGSYWFLPPILTFYGLFFLLIFFKKIKNIDIIGLSWISIGLFIWLLKPPYQSILKYFFIFFKYSHLFLAGMIASQTKKYGYSIKYFFIFFSCLITQFALFNFQESLITTILFIIFFLTISRKLRFLTNKLLIFIGLISYQLFLIHANIGYIIIRQFYQHNITSTVLLVFCPLTVSIILASILYFYIGKPAVKFIKNKFN